MTASATLACRRSLGSALRRAAAPAVAGPRGGTAIVFAPPPGAFPRTPPAGRPSPRPPPYHTAAPLPSGAPTDGGARPAVGGAAPPPATGPPKRKGRRTPRKSLRRLSSPFLMLCHPDMTGRVGGGGARSVNLGAVQTLNGLIDAVEALRDRAAADSPAPPPPGGRGGAGKIEIPERVEVEFLVPSVSGGTRKRKEGLSLTRRSVVLAFPRPMLEAAQKVDGDGRYSARAAAAVRGRARDEIVKLLKAAGLSAPAGYEEGGGRDRRAADDDDEEGGVDDYYLEDYMMEELDLDGRRSGSFGGVRYRDGERRSGPPLTAYEKSRRKFMARMDWGKIRKMYDEAVEDLKADVATKGALEDSEERRQNLIADVLSRVRVDTSAAAALASAKGDGAEGTKGGENEAKSDLAAAPAPDVSASDLERLGLDPLRQLIALRRLSMILQDNFESLEIEDTGRMWERLTLVLTPQRDALAEITGGPMRRRIKKGRPRESGFKFTYEADGRVTAYVPADFKDEELVGELQRNMEDFYNATTTGLEEFYPSWFNRIEAMPNP